MADLRQMEAQLEQTIAVLEGTFDRHEYFLAQFSAAIGNYLQVQDILKPLVEAAGAEIESRGRASPATIFGKKAFSAKRGKGLAQYVAEKGWTVSVLLRMISAERMFTSEQARYDLALLQETLVEEKEIAAMGRQYKSNKNMLRRLGMVASLLRKGQAAVQKEVSRDKQDLGATVKEITALRGVQAQTMQESASLRGMTWLVGAVYFQKRATQALSKEADFFRGFIKEESTIINNLFRDLKDTFSILQEHAKLQRQLGAPSPRLKAEAAKSKAQQAEAARLKNLARRMDAVQKHLRKVKQAAAKYGVRIAGAERAMMFEEKELAEDEKKIGRELDEIDRLIEYMNKLWTVINRFSNNTTSAEIRMKPVLSWINMSLLSTCKISAKNPAGGARFLDRIVAFTEKALIPALTNMENEERGIFKELIGEKGAVQRMDQDMKALANLEKRGFIQNLKDMTKKLRDLGTNVNRGTSKALADLRKNVVELQQSLAEAKQLAAAEAAAKAKATPRQIGETENELADLRARISELSSKKVRFNNEYSTVLRTFNRAIGRSPTFNFGESFLFGFLGSSPSKRMLSGTKLALKAAAGESKEEMEAIRLLRQWIQNKNETKLYGKFSRTLYITFKDEQKMMANLFNTYKNMASMEHSITQQIRDAEESNRFLQQGAQELQGLASRYPDIFGQEAKDIVAGIIALITGVQTATVELKKAGTAISAASHNLPMVEASIKHSEQTLPELEKISKESERNARKAMKYFGREVQMKFG